MNTRQSYALAHPVDRADLPPDRLAAHCADRKHATGALLRSILAVDR